MHRALALILLVFALLSAGLTTRAQPVPPELTANAVFGQGIPLSLAWSDDYLAVATTAGVWLYDAADLSAPAVPLGDTYARTESIAFNPADSSQLAIASSGAVLLVDVTTGNILQMFASGSLMIGLTFSADGTLLLARDGMHVYLWDTSTGDQLQTIALDGVLLIPAALSPDGAYIVTGSQDGVIRLWDAVTGDLLRDDFDLPAEVTPGPTIVIAFSPDSASFATADGNFNLSLFPVSDGPGYTYTEPYAGDPSTPTVRALDFLPDGRLVTMGDSFGGGVRLWEIEMDTLIEIAEFPVAGLVRFHALAVSPDASAVAVRYWLDDAPVVRTLALPDLAPDEPLAGFTNSVTLSLTGDESLLLTQGAGDLLLYDTATGEVSRRLTHAGTIALNATISADGVHAAACINFSVMSYEPELYLWSLPESSEGISWIRDFNRLCDGLAFRENRLYLVATDGIFQLERTNRMDPQLVIALENSYTSNATFGGGRVAFGVGGVGVHIHDLEFQQLGPIVILPNDDEVSGGFGSIPLALSTDRTLLARRAGPEGLSIALHQLEGDQMTLLPAPARVDALAFTADSAYLATGYMDGLIQIWDLATGEPIARLGGSDGGINALLFTADGRTLYSTADDGVVRVWDGPAVWNPNDS